MGEFNNTVIESMSVYPNLTTGNVTIKLGQTPTKFYEIRIYDSFGKKVISKHNIDQMPVFDMSKLANGIYNVILYDSGKIVDSKKLTLDNN